MSLASTTDPAHDDERGKAALARIIALAAEFATLADASGRAANLENLTAELATFDDLGEYADELEDLADELDNLCATRYTLRFAAWRRRIPLTPRHHRRHARRRDAPETRP